MIAKNSDSQIDLRLQNWNNFCQYHIGDWHGDWTRYNPQGEVIKTFQCIRSFRKSADGSEVNHQNHYTYDDGSSKTMDCGIYTKTTTETLFLDNSFSMGSTSLQSNSYFGFETGLKYDDRGVSAVVLYNESGKLERITIISEHLSSFEKSSFVPLINELSSNWQGTFRRMMLDLTITEPEKTTWKPLEDLNKDYSVFHFSDGISLSCPQAIENKNLFFVVDWLVNSTLLQRGSRHFESSEFKCFNLETFKSVK